MREQQVKTASVEPKLILTLGYTLLAALRRGSMTLRVRTLRQLHPPFVPYQQCKGERCQDARSRDPNDETWSHEDRNQWQDGLSIAQRTPVPVPRVQSTRKLCCRKTSSDATLTNLKATSKQQTRSARIQRVVARGRWCLKVSTCS
jgi:hypothetical protein